jgi:ribosome biogenesis SPOUT family RNA methylase Rps3
VKLDENMKFTITIGMAVVMIGGVIRLTLLVSEVNQRINEIAQSNDAKLTIERAAEVALREAIENPGHRVPDPRDPSEVLVVYPMKSDGR